MSGVGATWTKPCRQAITDLNALFRRHGIEVLLGAPKSQAPAITVKTDPSIQGSAVHGRTSAEADGSGRLIRAVVRLPVNVTINTPAGVRNAGPGVLEVIAAHEFVHALGREPHDSHLMAQTFGKVMGDTAAGDRLAANEITLPPLQLSSDTIDALKGIWN
jgi:hypothetical protein